VLNLFYSHLNVKLIRPEIVDVPSEAGVVERIINKDFDIQRRNLPQGLSISPMLFLNNNED